MSMRTMLDWRTARGWSMALVMPYKQPCSAHSLLAQLYSQDS